jgi:hypothetical protein
MRRSELPHERQKNNLAELLASKSWSRRTGKNFTDFAKNGVFQHNPPVVSVHVNGPLRVDFHPEVSRLGA